MQREESQNPLLEEELVQLLNPKGDISDMEMMIRKNLYIKFPRKLSKKERERMEEQQMQEKLEEEFQKLYGLDEDDEE